MIEDRARAVFWRTVDIRAVMSAISSWWHRATHGNFGIVSYNARGGSYYCRDCNAHYTFTWSGAHRKAL